MNLPADPEAGRGRSAREGGHSHTDSDGLPVSIDGPAPAIQAQALVSSPALAAEDRGG